MTRRLRVCHVITRLIVGGAQEAALLACAHVDRRRFASTLAAGRQTGAEGDLRPRAVDLGVPTVVIPTLVRQVAPARDRRAAYALRRLFREHAFDVVHTHSSKAGFLSRWAARRERVPMIVHTVHGWSFHDHMPRLLRAAYVRLERRAALWCDHIVTVSESDRDKGLAAGIGSPEQYVTIREVNDLAPYDAHAGERDEARRRLQLPVDSRVVGTVGRFTEQKDPVTWIRAAALLARQRADISFVMVGDGPLRAETEKAAASLGLADRLVTTGLRDDVPALLPALDVFLLTSRWEGAPLVIPQAMASGVPVVASAVDGNREIVRDRANGLLVPADAPDAAASAVGELLGDGALHAQLAAAGRRTTHEFSLGETIPRLEALYGCAGDSPQPTARSRGPEAQHERAGE
ncbi:MAG: glycosyltransferase family 4 protein [Acidimicrobiia bacterium]